MSPDETEPIEETLLRQRDLRRGQEGAPLEMHPATRQLLLSAVKRAREKPMRARRTRWFSWPALTWGFAAVIVALGTSWIIQTRQDQAPGRMAGLSGQDASQSEAVESHAERPALLAAERLEQGGRLSQAIPSPRSVAPALNRERVTMNGPASTVLRESLGASTTPVIIAQEAPAVPLAARDFAASAGPTEKLERLAGNLTDASVPPPATAPAKALTSDASTLHLPPIQPQAQPPAARLRTYDALSHALPGSPAAIPNLRYVAVSEKPSALNEFSVLQSDSTVQLVDADGSVYGGTLVSNALLETGHSISNQTGLELGLSRAKVAPSSAVYFRINGTNRTSQEQVSFEGSWAPNASPLTAGSIEVSRGLSFSGAVESNRTLLNGFAPSVAPASPARSLPTGRIKGRLQVGQQPEQWLEAVPLAPAPR